MIRSFLSYCYFFHTASKRYVGGWTFVQMRQYPLVWVIFMWACRHDIAKRIIAEDKYA